VKTKFHEDTCTDLFESISCQEASAPEPLRAVPLQQLQEVLAFSDRNRGSQGSAEELLALRLI